jgi:hypothetical protein
MVGGSIRSSAQLWRWERGLWEGLAAQTARQEIQGHGAPLQPPSAVNSYEDSLLHSCSVSCQLHSAIHGPLRSSRQAVRAAANSMLAPVELGAGFQIAFCTPPRPLLPSISPDLIFHLLTGVSFGASVGVYFEEVRPRILTTQKSDWP